MRRFFIFLVKLYQKYISPLKKPSCRYYPTCSVYSIEAFKKHGAFKGMYLTIKRLARCNPFSKGGVDYVPDKFYFFNKKKT